MELNSKTILYVVKVIDDNKYHVFGTSNHDSECQTCPLFNLCIYFKVWSHALNQSIASSQLYFQNIDLVI